MGKCDSVVEQFGFATDFQNKGLIVPVSIIPVYKLSGAAMENRSESRARRQRLARAVPCYEGVVTFLSPKSVHSLLRSIAGSSSSSFSSPNLPNCSSPRESASVYAAYLRSHFSISQPKALRNRARGYLTKLRQATCPVEFHSSFCSPFTLAEFHAAASNLSSSTATGPDKVAYLMLKHLPRSGMDFLLHIFNLSWS